MEVFRDDLWTRPELSYLEFTKVTAEVNFCTSLFLKLRFSPSDL